MKKIFFGVLILIVVLNLQAGKRALDFKTFFSLQRISNLTLSPDGKLVALVLRQASLENNNYRSQVVIFDLNSREYSALPIEGNQSSPVFIDNNRLSLLATLQKETQLFLFNLKEKNYTQLTSVPQGISNYSWVEPLKSIAFTTEIFPQFMKLEESLEFEAIREKNLGRAKIFTTIPFRVWNSYKDDKYSNLFWHKIGSNEYQNLTPGAYDTPPIDLGSKRDYDFSPDGKFVAYVKNTDPLIAISTNNDIFLKDIVRNSEVNLTAANRGNDFYPRFSPKGTYLFYLSMPRAGFEADQRYLMVYNLKTKKLENLTGNLDLSVGEYFVLSDEKSIFFTAEEGVYNNLYELNLKTRKVKKIISSRNISEFVYHPATSRIYLLIQSATHPNELFGYDLKKNKLEKLSDFNRRQLAEVEMNPVELFQFSGANDEKVEGVMIKPPFFDSQKKYPMAFLIHGGPQGAWSDEFHFRWNYQMFAQAGFVVVAINFHGSTGYGQKFTDSISGEWGGLPFEDLVKGQAYVVENFPFIDADKIIAAGASYGGFMINWIAGHHQSFKYPFRALVSHSGIFDSRSMYYSTEELWFEEWEYRGTPWTSDLYEKWNPANFVTNFKIPMLVVHGEKDYRVPVSQGMMLFTALQRLGVKSKMLYFEDEDHFVQKPQNARLWWETVIDWCQTHIK